MAKRQMSKEEAMRFDAYRYQQMSRQNFSSHEATWFDQVEQKIVGLVDDAIVGLDNRTGGYGRQGTAWVERELAGVSKALQNWWQS